MLKMIERKEQIGFYKAIEALRNTGVSYESIEKFNICYEDDRTEKQFGKILFPVYDENGNKCGIVAKKIDKDNIGATYTIQIPDDIKVFGLNLAINSAENSFILCEGVPDTILLHQNGFDNAVGCLTSTVSAEFALRLKKHKTKVYVIFDSDGFGKQKAKKAVDTLTSVGIKAVVVDLGEYLDPMQILQGDTGAEMLRKLIKSAEESKR